VPRHETAPLPEEIVTPPVTRSTASRVPPNAPRRVAIPAPTAPRATITSVPEPLVVGGATVTQRTTSSADTSETAERRAIRLLASGRSDEAAIVFDTIVMANPFYRLDPADSTSEAVAALRSSKRLILPTLARRQYESASAAFDADDFDRATAEAERAAALLNDGDIGVAPADLSAAVKKLLAVAASAKLLDDEKVYTASDSGVSPPRPLGRQLPVALPPGVSSQSVGRLEVLVNRAGEVERVKLHTPMNRYYDRMIVSAAKAWQYKPALKNGKPVKFNLVIAINLPES